MAEYQMFYFATNHINRDYIISELKKELKEEAQYLVTEETSKTSHTDVSGQHFHIIAQITDKQYTNYSKRIITKLGLRGKADLGLSRQYGKVKIKDLDRALSYILKDNGVKHTNMSQEQIQAFYDKSFKKDESRDLRKYIISVLIEEFDTIGRWSRLAEERSDHTFWTNHFDWYEECVKAVIFIMIKEKAPVVSKTQIENIIKQFVQQSENIVDDDKINLLRSLNQIRNPFKII